MSHKIKGLDGIRGLAVTSVVLTHLGVFSYLEALGIINKNISTILSGATGVQAFFVLSGFLITLLLIQENKSKQKVSLINFYMRRILRILPLYLLFLLLATLIHIFIKDVTNWLSLFFAYFYLYDIVPRGIYSGILGHTWSLAVEEHFYLIWPFIFVATYPKNNRLIISGLIIFILFSFVLLNFFKMFHLIDRVFFIERWTIISGSHIALGCVAALLIAKKTIQVRFHDLLKIKPYLWIGIVLLCNSIYLPNNIYFIGIYLRSIGLSLIIAWTYLNQKSYLVRILEFAPLRYIGLISYGVYIYQGLFLTTGPARIPGQNWPPSPFMGLLLLIIVAPLSYHFFEKPFLRLKRNYK